MLSVTKKKEIEAVAADALAIVYPNDRKAKLPIDLVKIATSLGITVKQAEFEDVAVSGAFDKTTKTIYVAQGEPFDRQAFTIAHELGHLLLHSSKKQEIFYRTDMFQIGNSLQEEEQEANWFAASLLMPEGLVRKYEPYADTSTLANVFGASNSAVYYRLKNLNLVE